MNTKVAFFRVEGVLLKPGVLPLAMYLTVNSAGLRERVLRTGAVALFSPVYQVLKSKDRQTVNRLLYQCFQGMGEDRVRYLLEEYFEDCLQDKVLERGKTFLRSAQEGRFSNGFTFRAVTGTGSAFGGKVSSGGSFSGKSFRI
jgi:hypothetical protein